MNKISKIFIAGHTGMVGSAFLRFFRKKKYKNVYYQIRKKLDLTNQTKVFKYFKNKKFDVLIICSAKVGGIYANNTYPHNFIRDNLQIQNNLLEAAFINKIGKVLFLGSSCIYPRNCKQPMKEDMLLSGHLEKTNEQYAIAKLAGIKYCEGIMRQYGSNANIDFRTILPPNLFGDNDNYDPKNSHVIASLIRKITEAKKNKIKKVYLWGDGTPKREFLHVDDLIETSIELLKIPKKKYWKHFKKDQTHLNVGSGYETSIVNLAKIISELVEYYPIFRFNKKMPNGVKRKIMSNSKIKTILKSYKPYNEDIFKKKLVKIIKI
tara:strand:+ start:2687 stop:3649 length:963 start_codon:yes stop_codon:yes gene_type:complete